MSTKKYVVQHKNKKKKERTRKNEHKDTPYLYIRARSTEKKKRKEQGSFRAGGEFTHRQEIIESRGKGEYYLKPLSI